MNKEIDHNFTKEVVCPHCGWKLRDSWELDDSGYLECEECEKEFFFERDITVRYCTGKIKKEIRI
jgi:DNA-directed RNA polymerase subunit RPC12/RpoP